MINLTTGAYFIVKGTGAEVWAGIEGGAETGALVADLATRYGEPEVGVAAAVNGFLEDLRENGLIVDNGDAASAAPPASTSQDPADAPGSFQPPMLEKYTDMEHLIRMDPIHDADPQRGWPERRD